MNPSYFSAPGLVSGFLFPTNRIDAEKIIDAVCNVMKIERWQLNVRTRVRLIVESRQMAMYLIKKHTSMSLKEIGIKMGGYDHTTVIHSITTMQNLLETDQKMKNLLHQISYKI